MSRTYGSSLSAVSSTEMPTTWKPWRAYLSWNSMKCGISTLHGPHQVAQKSSSSTFPLNADNVTSLPATSFIEKFRLAGFASAGHESIGGAACSPPSSDAPADDDRSTMATSC